MTNFQKLAEFHEAINGRNPDKPLIPSADIINLRESLISEEYKETMEALKELKNSDNKDDHLASLMHELADLLYVCYGTFVDFGVDADKVFAEIHRVNMLKLTGPKRADGKQLKPEGWQPANIQAIIDEMS